MVSRKRLYRLVGLAAFAIVFAVLFRTCDSMSTVARRASGGNDLKELFLIIGHHAVKYDGLLPTLDPEPGRLMVERNIMFEEFGVTGRTTTMEYDTGARYSWKDYHDNPTLLKDRDLIDDNSWWYLGYTVKNEEEGRAFLRGYLHHVTAGRTFDGNLDTGRTDAQGNAVTLTRLERPDIAGLKNWPSNKEENPGADASITPVFIERPGFWKNRPGGYVLYLDGSMEFIEYPGKFPMTREFIRGLQLLDELGPLIK